MQRTGRAVLRGKECLRKSCRLLTTLDTHHRTPAVPPPEASEDQIFTGGTAPKQETVLGSDAEWQEAVSRLSRPDADRSLVPKNDAALFASNRIGQVALPAPLVAALNAVLRDTHSPSLRTTALRFYESTAKSKNEGGKQRSDVPMPGAKDFDGLEAAAYVAGFVPQLYASCTTVLLELRKRLGQSFAPSRVLDCGLGPGTAALAFHETFSVTNDRTVREEEQGPTYTILQENEWMRGITKDVWSAIGTHKDHHRIVSRVNFSPTATAAKFDVVLAPHILGNFKGRPSDRDALVMDVWSRVSEDGGTLLLLERGNPLGFEHIARARQLILRHSSPSSTSSSSSTTTASSSTTSTAHVLAPCPHDASCPLFTGPELGRHLPRRTHWCHFSQRVQRPDFLQRVKRSKDNTEDVPFSYVLVRRGERPGLSERYVYANHARTGTGRDGHSDEGMVMKEEGQREIVRASYAWPRIVSPPLKQHKHILIDTCAPPAATDQTGHSVGRLERHTVPKSQGPSEYTFARKSHWGDSLPFNGKTRVPARIMDSTKERKEITKKQAEREKSRRDQEREKEEKRMRGVHNESE